MGRILVDGKEVNTRTEIKKEFKKFYAGLYQRRQTKEEEIREYLRHCDLQKLTDGQRKNLNDQISEEEILKAITALKSGKSPGPDGYTARFYRVFKEDLVKHLQKLFNGILQGSSVSDLAASNTHFITQGRKSLSQC